MCAGLWYAALCLIAPQGNVRLLVVRRAPRYGQQLLRTAGLSVRHPHTYARHWAAQNATFAGPPLNRDGKILVTAGVPETEAQPPCLLRYSPQLWAKECPTMFAYDEETNTLSLQPGRHPPWIRKTSEQDQMYTREWTKTWLYCALGVARALVSARAPCGTAPGQHPP